MVRISSLQRQLRFAVVVVLAYWQLHCQVLARAGNPGPLGLPVQLSIAGDHD